MKTFLADNLVEPVASGLLGGATVDDGPTAEQIAVLQAIVSHLWHRPDIDVKELTPLDADALAKITSDEPLRHLLVGILMTLECCRHPQTETQVHQIERYANALSISGEPLGVIRTWITDGAIQASADLMRFQKQKEDEAIEPAFLHRTPSTTEPDPAVREKILELSDLPKGTLGRSYIDFHEEFGIALPGSGIDATFSDGVLISHDLNHVISGYSPTGEGEVALGAMEFAMNDSEGTWSRFLASLAIHEAGMSRFEDFTAKEATLSRPGAADLLGEAFERGNLCTSDFSRIDHLSMAAWTMEEVREHFGVVPLAGGDWLRS